jgi:hypothetical protein
MEETEKILYHYTSLEGLLGIIESKSIWATNILYLNDASELNYSIKLLGEEINNVKEKISVDDKNIGKFGFFNELIENIDIFISNSKVGFFVCSFSEENDLLSQWRGYCPGGIGFSIGFKLNELRKCAQNITPCNYSEENQKNVLSKLINKISSQYDTEIKKLSWPGPWGEAELKLFIDLLIEFLEVAPTFKHPKFKAEKEWRIIKNVQLHYIAKLIKFRAGQSMVLPYVEIPLPQEENHLRIDQIVVGPTHEPKLSKASVELLLISKEVKFGEVQHSTIPYRNW